jgi:FkbM family methyltransferase
MPFVSYAQNLEDVILFRALRHVDNGFYVDVGAYSSDVDSVTKAFYERGWNGINVEPNPARINELTTSRPRDLNLAVAVSDSDGWIELYVLSNPGLTTLEPDVAERHKNTGLSTSVINVQRTTLSHMLEEHVGPDQAIHFLKIDVEGHELAALRGLDLQTYRPWILVIEATAPMSQETTHEQWEALILNYGYHFVYWDGLNRFYLADEQKILKSAFSSPPNVFDDFKMAGEVIARESQELAKIALREAELREHVAQAHEREISNLLEDAKSTVALLSRQIDYLNNRSLWEKLLFRSTGKPKRALRRLLFHKSGKPRGIFKAAVLHKDGRPHRPFRMWIESQEYLKMQGVAHRDRRQATLGRAQLASVQIMVALSSAQHLQSQESVTFLEVDHDA